MDEPKTETIEARIEKIEQRNSRVEADKRWEGSILRRVSIAILTYIVACLFLYAIHESNWFLKALIPVAGFILSTISLKAVRKMARY